VRHIAGRFGELLGVTPKLSGSELPTSLLSDSSLCTKLLGPPSVSVEEMIEMIAGWIAAGGLIWDKPTHFEVRDGKF
jgi:hypothetical protein